MRNRLLVIALLIISIKLLGISMTVRANDQMSFSHIYTENGLSHNTVYCMIQDTKGFVWIGTPNGLNRYDGVSFKTYYKEELGVNSSNITSLCEDNDGNIWVGTKSGVTVFLYEEDCFRKVESETETGQSLNNNIIQISRASGSGVWLAAENKGLFYLNVKTGESRHYFYENDTYMLPFNIVCFYFDMSGTCWLSLEYDNLYKVRGDFSVLEPFSLSDGTQPYKGDNVNRIIKGPFNTLIVSSTKKGVTEIKPMSGIVNKVFPALQSGFLINDIYLESDKVLWMAANTGLYSYNLLSEVVSNYGTVPGDDFSLTDKECISVMTDNENGVWVGTFSGLNYHNRGYLDFYRYSRAGGVSLKGQLVRGFAEEENGVIWVATKGAGLLRYYQNSDLLVPYENEQIPDNIYGMCQDWPYLWISSHNGVCRLDTRNDKVRFYINNDDNAPAVRDKTYGIYKNSHGELFVGSKHGLLKLEKGFDSFEMDTRFEGIMILDIFEDSSGNMLFCTNDHGLILQEANTDVLHFYVNDPQNSNSIPVNKVLSTFEDSKKRIWITTHGAGIALLNYPKGTFNVYDFFSDGASSITHCIVEDDSGLFWVTTNNGLVRFSPEYSDRKVFLVSDGLLNNEFDYSSGIKASTGDIFFGSIDGFIRFNPLKVNKSIKYPSIVITDMYINGKVVKPKSEGSPLLKSIDRTDQLKLSAKENNLGFHFSVLSFLSPTNNYVYYRLKGFSDEWIKTSSRQLVSFNNLNPGKYRLEVKGVSSDGVWNESHPSLSITIKPRIYETAVAYLIYFLVIIGAITAIIFYQRRRILKQQQQRLLAFEKNREIEMYNEKIDFFSNIAHEIKTPLTLIQTPLENIINTGGFDEDIEDDLKLINNNTHQLSQLIGELLDFSKVEQQGFVLNCVEMDAVEKIAFMIYGFSAAAKNKNVQINYEHEADHIIIKADEQCLTKIFSNLLLNAIKYAETYINVSVRADEKNLTVSVKNDGPIVPLEKRKEIFNPFVQYKDAENVYTKGFGIGLSLSKKLAELHDGTVAMDRDTQSNNFIVTLPCVLSVGIQMAGESEDQKEEDVTLPVVLLVEDNKELLMFVKRKISNTYNVITAEDGVCALEILNKRNVDVIVTDISMAGMSGLELIEKLKMNFETSHIPIIVLSAMSSLQNKITSMENGADIFIEKPFSIDYLVSCIESLLTKRKKLIEIYSSESEPSPFAANLSKRDEEFLISMEKDILENMEDSEYSIEQLANHLCLSKSSLNRKFKGLLNTTPNDYIKVKRLVAAAGMIREGSERINEICFKIGFNSHTYFLKCFKNYYGMLPSEYKKKHEN